MIVLREIEYLLVPWKNGGGVTREIHKFPPDAAQFEWRLSLATIERPGPFSAFDGYERTLVLMRGAGVALDFGPHGRETLDTAGQVARFDGSWPTTCTLLDGPSTDLNLIVSKSTTQARARVTTLAAAETVQTSGWDDVLFCCVAGAARIENASGALTKLTGSDVARCGPDDGLVTVRPQGTEPVRMFIAALRRRDAPGATAP